MQKKSIFNFLNNNPLLLCDFHYLVIFIIIQKIIKKKKKLDKTLIGILLASIGVYMFGRISNKGEIIAFNHFIYASLMVVTPILSNDNEILLLIVAMSIAAIGTRKIFNGCLIRKVETQTTLVENKFTKMLNWDYIFPSIGLLACYKLSKNI